MRKQLDVMDQFEESRRVAEDSWNGSIVGLTRHRERDATIEDLAEAKLLGGLGMEGNLHRGGQRQLCLLTTEIRRWMDEQSEKGLCFRRFKENLLLKDVPLEKLSVGDMLEIGTVRLRISGIKPCFDECPRFSEGLGCRLDKSAVFAAVEVGGMIQVGDRVVHG